MMKFMLKTVIFMAMGVGTVAFAIPLTTFKAATPWRWTGTVTDGGLSVQRSQSVPDGTIVQTEPVQAMQIVEHVLASANGTPIPSMPLRRSIDFGAIMFMVILFSSGALAGQLLRKRKRVQQEFAR